MYVNVYQKLRFVYYVVFLRGGTLRCSQNMYLSFLWIYQRSYVVHGLELVLLWKFIRIQVFDRRNLTWILFKLVEFNVTEY